MLKDISFLSYKSTHTKTDATILCACVCVCVCARGVYNVNSFKKYF